MEKIIKLRPFLKWAGNKYRILDMLLPVLPKLETGLEPFAGSAAIFMNTNYSKYHLADSNPDLILLYEVLACEGEKFVRYARKFFVPNNNQTARYYELREQFNSLALNRKKAALFLYLNRHGYNGLCRYNQQGIYNVPFGKYTKPYFPAGEMLNFYQKAQATKLTISCQDFGQSMGQSNLRKTLIYCDPPYVPLRQKGFTEYSSLPFPFAKQEQLAELARYQRTQGNWVILSNHDLPVVRELFWDAEIISFPVPRYINCQGQLRVPVKEILAIYPPSVP